jgi:hypothetical protein
VIKHFGFQDRFLELNLCKKGRKGQCNRNDHLASCGYTGRVIIEKQLKQKKIPKIMFKNVFNILVKLQGTLTFNPIKFNPYFNFKKRIFMSSKNIKG